MVACNLQGVEWLFGQGKGEENIEHHGWIMSRVEVIKVEGHGYGWNEVEARIELVGCHNSSDFGSEG